VKAARSPARDRPTDCLLSEVNLRPWQAANPLRSQMQYLLPANPASPSPSLKQLRERARCSGYLIAADYCTGTFTLVDARLRLPILGLDHVGLPEIARAIETVRKS